MMARVTFMSGLRRFLLLWFISAVLFLSAIRLYENPVAEVRVNKVEVYSRWGFDSLAEKMARIQFITAEAKNYTEQMVSERHR